MSLSFLTRAKDALLLPASFCAFWETCAGCNTSRVPVRRLVDAIMGEREVVATWAAIRAVSLIYHRSWTCTHFYSPMKSVGWLTIVFPWRLFVPWNTYDCQRQRRDIGLRPRNSFFFSSKWVTNFAAWAWNFFAYEIFSYDSRKFRLPLFGYRACRSTYPDRRKNFFFSLIIYTSENSHSLAKRR